MGRDINNIQRNLISSLTSLRGDIMSALELPLYEQTPAEKEAEKIRKQEAARDRQQAVNDAKSRTKAQTQEFNRASKELKKAQNAVQNASTADEKREARQRLATAKANYNQAKKNLEDAVKQENEIKHDAAVQARLDYLDELAVQQRQAVQKRVNQAKAEADALYDGLMNAVKDKDWNKAQKYINKIVKLLGDNSIFELGSLTADYLVKGIEEGLKKNQRRINNAAKKSAKQAALAATGEPLAEQLLKSTTADEDISGGGPGASLTSKWKLNYLLQNAKVDMNLAGAILKAIDNTQLEKKIIRRMFKLLGIKLNVKDVLKGRSPENYLLSFLDHHPDQPKALAAFAQAVYGLQIFEKGGQVRGSQGAAVPIIAHVGEWVLNKGQQNKLSARMGESTGSIKNFLFGKDSGKPKKHFASGGEITDAHERMNLGPIATHKAAEPRWNLKFTLTEAIKEFGWMLIDPRVENPHHMNDILNAMAKKWIKWYYDYARWTGKTKAPVHEGRFQQWLHAMFPAREIMEIASPDTKWNLKALYRNPFYKGRWHDLSEAVIQFASGGEITDAHQRMNLADWVPAKKSWEKGISMWKTAGNITANAIPWSKGWRIVDAAANLVSKPNLLDPIRGLPGILQTVLGGKNTYQVAKTQITDMLGLTKGALAGNFIDQAILSLMFLPGLRRAAQETRAAIKYGEKLGIVGIGSAPAKWRIFGARNQLSEVERRKLQDSISETWQYTRRSRKGLDKGGRANDAADMAQRILGFSDAYDKVVVAMNAKNQPIGVGAYQFDNYGDYDYVPYASGIGGGGLHVFKRLLGIAHERRKGIDFDSTRDALKLYRAFGIAERGGRFRIEPQEVELLLKDSRALLRRARMKKAALVAGLKSGKIQFYANDPVLSRKDAWEVLLEDLDTFLDEPWKNRFNQVLRDTVEKQNRQGRLVGSHDITNKEFFEELATTMAWRDYARANPDTELWRFSDQWDVKNKNLIKARAKFLKTLFKESGYHFSGRYFQRGGEIEANTRGAAVPIIAHAGEWVLNKEQQAKIAKKLFMPIEKLKKFVFGEHDPITNQQYESSPFNPRRGQSRRYGTFELVSHTDDDKNELWFVEFDDGAYGQVSARDAKRIQRTGGQWVPDWIRRSKGAGHGFTASYLDYGPFFGTLGKEKKKKAGRGTMYSLARGGEILASMASGYNPSVLNSYVQSYAAGGVVTATPHGINSGDSINKTVNQNFNVHTEGETDWNYVMRLGAIHALG